MSPARFNEAGARTPQKAVGRVVLRAVAAGASMRLGRERPRKLTNLRADRRKALVASMRLGRERPRKGGGLRGLSRGGRASMRLGRERPRKTAEAQRAIFAAIRFNEAGARTPQKGRVFGAARPRLAAASMRLGRERPRKGGECVDHAASRIASMRLGRERPRKCGAAGWTAPHAPLQ